MGVFQCTQLHALLFRPVPDFSECGVKPCTTLHSTPLNTLNSSNMALRLQQESEFEASGLN